MFTAFTQLWRRSGPDIMSGREALRGVREAGIPTFRESLPRLGLELRRARRYERMVAALALAPARATLSNGAGGEESFLPHLGGDAVSRYLTFFLFGSLIKEALRETDVLAYSPEQQFYAVLLPESGEAEALRAVARIGQIVEARMEMGLRAGVAEFPRHGLTVEDLFANAHKEWDGHRWVGKIPVLKELSNG